MVLSEAGTSQVAIVLLAHELRLLGAHIEVEISRWNIGCVKLIVQVNFVEGKIVLETNIIELRSKIITGIPL